MTYLRKHFSTIIIVCLFFIGIGLLAYPTVANWWNSFHATHTVNSYNAVIDSLSVDEYDRYLQEAEEYNNQLMEKTQRFRMTDEERAVYEKLLSVDDSQVMGAVNIPSVKISLPIFHGTSEEVLAAGAGHLEGTSLPIGGIGTHTVITGHRGLPSAKLFTDLDQVVEGDYVILNVLNETLTYQIDTIRIVLPKEVESLEIDPNQDLCTLVTCTPYGVNTHRMLLTGHRVENRKEFELTKEAKQVDSKMVALFIAIPLLVILFVWLMWSDRKKKNIGKEVDEDEE